MAKYRNVSVKFWSDEFVAEELTPEKRYFFLYLLTNEHTSQCGIYEITIRQMAFETGYNSETIEKLLQFFEQHGKIKWSKDTKEIAIKNFVKYNPQGSPKVKVYVQKELTEVKNKELIDFLETSKLDQKYPIDTVSQKEEELELEKEESKNNDKAAPNLEDRKSKFYSELVPFVDKYGKDMIRAFYDYWTEANKKKTRMRFEDEKFFDVTKRLVTWHRNDTKKTFKGGAEKQNDKPFLSPLKKRDIHA